MGDQLATSYNTPMQSPQKSGEYLLVFVRGAPKSLLPIGLDPPGGGGPALAGVANTLKRLLATTLALEAP
jgi:hypothetical protein